MKPSADFLFALLLFLCVLPFFVPLCIYLKLKNGKVFFIQERIGKNNKIFKIYKLQTMNEARDSKGVLLPDHMRITPIGQFLRKYSIDEIPQLLNILKFELSFVGPRPLLVEYLPLYNNEQIRRHDVTPGITGWAQVNGRNVTTWQRRFRLDVEYVNNISLFLDLEIALLTIKKVFFAEDVNSSSSDTMPRFTGNE